jgi:hypothetical protein
LYAGWADTRAVARPSIGLLFRLILPFRDTFSQGACRRLTEISRTTRADEDFGEWGSFDNVHIQAEHLTQIDLHGLPIASLAHPYGLNTARPPRISAYSREQ